jgi:Tol biopolymer transport system component
MSRHRIAVACLLLGSLAAACEPAQEQASTALASIGLPSPTIPGGAPKQATVTRRINWDVSPTLHFSPFPDGRRLAVGPGGVYEFVLATREMNTITESSDGADMYPVVSPEGDRIADSFESWVPPLWERRLQVMDAGGGEPRKLYSTLEGWIQAEDWSQDGLRLLALHSAPGGRNEIVSLSIDDGAVTVLKELERASPKKARFSPDGRYVAYDNPARDGDDEDNWDVFVLDTQDDGETVLVGGPWNDQLMGWAPDGHSVLFLSDRGGTPGAWLQPVAAGQAVGDPHLVKPDMWNVGPVGFDREGRYYYTVRVGARALKEVTLAPDGRSVASEPTDLTSRDHGWVHLASWSPEGQHIAMTISRTGGPFSNVLLIRSAESGEEREVLQVEGRGFSDLAWMPDGQSVVATVRREQGATALVKIDVRTGETVDLLEVDNSDEPLVSLAVSPDGNTVYYTRQDFTRMESRGDGEASEQIMALDLETGTTRGIHRYDAGGPLYTALAISPDGTTLAFGFHTQGGGSIDKQRLYVIPTAGGTPRTVADGRFGSCAWTVDGKSLLCFRLLVSGRGVSQGPKLGLERVDVATGETTPLGLEGIHFGPYISLHPDGRRVLFGAGRPGAEWWVMEGFLGPK